MATPNVKGTNRSYEYYKTSVITAGKLSLARKVRYHHGILTHLVLFAPTTAPFLQNLPGFQDSYAIAFDFEVQSGSIVYINFLPQPVIRVDYGTQGVNSIR
jgi:hypothetical protein